MRRGAGVGLQVVDFSINAADLDVTKQDRAAGFTDWRMCLAGGQHLGKKDFEAEGGHGKVVRAVRPLPPAAAGRAAAEPGDTRLVPPPCVCLDHAKVWTRPRCGNAASLWRSKCSRQTRLSSSTVGPTRATARCALA